MASVRQQYQDGGVQTCEVGITSASSHVAVVCLEHKLRIRDVPCSHLHPETGYPY
jgi:hypothetical protein